MLEIMHDSRIGSFGTLAICLSLLARWGLLSAMPVARFPLYLLTAHVLCRWTTLPLGAFMDSARSDGLGAKLAHKIPLTSAAHRHAAGISHRRLGAAHASSGADRGGQPDHAAQRVVLPLADRRRHRRLLWRHQSAGRNRSLRVRSVGMSRTHTPAPPARTTLILVRHAHTDIGRTLLRTHRSAAQRRGMAQLSDLNRAAQSLSAYSHFQQRSAARPADGGVDRSGSQSAAKFAGFSP